MYETLVPFISHTLRFNISFILPVESLSSVSTNSFASSDDRTGCQVPIFLNIAISSKAQPSHGPSDQDVHNGNEISYAFFSSIKQSRLDLI